MITCLAKLLGLGLVPESGGTHADVRPNAAGNPAAIGVGSEPMAGTLLANGSFEVAWLSNTTLNIAVLTASNTTIQPAEQHPVGPTPRHVIAADFNNDGIADLAVSNFGNLSTNTGGTVAIFFGKSDGTFTPGPVASAATPVDMYAADFNADGKMDLVYGDVDDSQVVVLLGNGDGTFRAPVTYAVGFPPQSIVAADFNGDGKLDLVAATDESVGGPGALSILIGNGDGSFQPANKFVSGMNTATYLAWADLNGDGKTDLAVADPRSNAIAFVFGNGDGSFQPPVEYATGAYPFYFGLAAMGGQFQIGAVDTVSGEFDVMPLSAAGIAGAPPIYKLPDSANSVTGVAAADLNGDGYSDIVVADQAISILLRVPNGQFRSPVNYSLQSGLQAVSVATGDLNGDGHNDVVAASTNIGSSGGNVEVAFGRGDGTLGAQASYTLGGSPGGFGAAPGGIVVADFNGDGKPDVAAGYTGTTGSIAVLLNRGTGALMPPVNYSLGGLSASHMVTGDFNGDGKPDLAACGNVANASVFTAGAIGVLLGKSDGTFQNAVLTPVGSPAGMPLALAVGDVNKDGKLDLVATVQSSSFTYSAAVLLGNGDGTFRTLTPFAIPTTGSAVALVDLNGDGVPDLVLGDCCGLTESVYLLGNGDGTFQAPQYFNSGASTTAFAVTSWNNDGVAGLAIGHENSTVEAMVSTLNPRLYSSSPTLSIVSSHSGNFMQGQVGATYTLTVSNAVNAAPVAGTVTVTEVAPPGLTLTAMSGTGWNCSGNTCTRNDALVGGGVYPAIAATVNVSATAASPQVNTVRVSGGGSASASATDSTVITSTAAAALSIVSSHTGSFAPGRQGAVYFVTVSNAAGAASTSGTVTVVENLPSGLTLVSMTGGGWTCSANSCTRGDVLAGGASYPVITVTVNVASNAASPQVNAVSVTGGGSAPASATDSTVITALPAGLGFFPVTPCRIADTRSGQGFTGQFGPPSLAANQVRNFVIPSSGCNVPATAQAYSLNITVVPAGGLNYLTIWPAGQSQPLVSTLNSLNGAILANAAIVPAGAGGAVSVYVTNAADLIIDINGYFAPPAGNALAFYPVTPCRVADTRGTNGQFGGPPLGASGTRSFTVPQSACNIPSTAQAYSLNMTAIPPAPLTYLTTWPAGHAQPLVSTLNAFQGQIVANAAIVPAGTGGAINVFVSDPSNVIVDINGYFAPPGSPGALYFYPVTPCRVADTRGATGLLGGPSLGAGGSRTFPIPASACGLPATAQAYSFNMTVVPSGPLLYLSTWPAGQTQPVVSTLNDLQGKVVANAAIVPAGTSGAISVFVNDATNVIIDVNGYFGH
ncbi:MAG TPA: FG-GAP-like repeat-containing protein [Bryobacteraceae bacterium]|nr:FG-GAP-like repeat-containing protein [Bryobacteraceae bacterium]